MVLKQISSKVETPTDEKLKLFLWHIPKLDILRTTVYFYELLSLKTDILNIYSSDYY